MKMWVKAWSIVLGAFLGALAMLAAICWGMIVWYAWATPRIGFGGAAAVCVGVPWVVALVGIVNAVHKYLTRQV